MSNDSLNKIEILDLQIREIFLNATKEIQVETAIRNYTFTASMGSMYVSKLDYGGNRRDDGTIYFNGKGLIPVGINESKFGNNGRSIYGSRINAAFAQAIAYHNLSKLKTHKFIWISHNEYFFIYKISDNKELIEGLCELYRTHPLVTPCNTWTIEGIGNLFSRLPLIEYRSWIINNKFRFSEVIEETLKIIEED